MATTPRIGLIANGQKPGAKALLETLLEAFAAAGLRTAVEEDSAVLLQGSRPEVARGTLAEVAAGSDLLVVLGGDGTLLGVMGRLASAVKPIAAINVGTLGFLTCATARDHRLLVDAIATGTYEISRRAIIEAELPEGGTGQPGRIFYALNEVTVVRGATSSVVHVETRVDGAFVNHYTGDGIIISTPTGSTAYSLSAGGPILEPGCGVFVMTPICPHALANRSIVFDDRREIEVLAPSQRDELLITADGRVVCEVGPPRRLRIRRASFELPLVTLPGASFYAVLRRKLGWFGSSVVNSGEEPGDGGAD